MIFVKEKSGLLKKLFFGKEKKRSFKEADHC